MSNELDNVKAPEGEVLAPGLLASWDPQATHTIEGVVQESRVIVRMNAITVTELGARLAWLKERSERGEFDKRLEEIGIPRRTAYRYLRASAILAGSSCHVARLAISKVYATLDLPDDELAELYDGKEVRGKTLDAFDRMTASEVRVWAREAQGQITRGEKQLSKKEQELAVANGRMLLKDTGQFLALVIATADQVEAACESGLDLCTELMEADEETTDRLPLRRRTFLGAVARIWCAAEELARRARFDVEEPLALSDRDHKEIAQLAGQAVGAAHAAHAAELDATRKHREERRAAAKGKKKS